MHGRQAIIPTDKAFCQAHKDFLHGQFFIISIIFSAIKSHSLVIYLSINFLTLYPGILDPNGSLSNISDLGLEAATRARIKATLALSSALQ